MDDTYCVSCRKKTGNVNSQVINMINNKKRISSICADCRSKKSSFIK